MAHQDQCDITSKDIQCFVFSWNEFYNNARKIETQLSNIGIDVKVINSSNDRYDHWINLSTDCYFNDQFSSALDLFDRNKYKFFFHIQADASIDNWLNIVHRFIYVANKYKIGIYAPLVENVFYERQYHYGLLELNLVDVNFIDETVWFINKEILSIFEKDIRKCFVDNFYGWGYDKVLCALCHMSNMPVLMDTENKIQHPQKQNYETHKANQNYITMINKLPQGVREFVHSMEFLPENIRNL